jgi:dTDP-4-dehydrorhamnose 3,5-epimerase-like enzyme
MSLEPRGLATVTDLAVVAHKVFGDARGSLVPVELTGAVPFSVARLFWVFDVPDGGIRGGHAHRMCSQYLVCVKGRIEVETSDGVDTGRHVLEAGHALLLPPAIWALERYVTPDAMLLVLCDRPYEREDYIDRIGELRDFREEAQAGRTGGGPGGPRP